MRSRLAWLVMAALAVLLLIAGVVFLRPSEPAATAVAAATETAPPPTATEETQPAAGLVAVALAASDTPAPTSTETPEPTVTNTAVRPTRVPTKTRTPFFTRTPTPAPYLASQKNITCGKSPATGKLNIFLEAGDYQSYLWHYDYPAPSAQLIVGGFTHALNGSKTSSVKFTLTESGTHEVRYYFECRSPGVAGGYTLTWLQPPFANVQAWSNAASTEQALHPPSPTSSLNRTATPTLIPRVFSVTFNNTRGDDKYIFVEGKLLGRVPANKSASFPVAAGNYYIQVCTGRDRTGCDGFQAMIRDNITFNI